MLYPDILYAETNFTLRRIVSDLLNWSGFHVETCSEGQIARIHIESQVNYKLFLLDSDLPDLDAFDLVKAARRIPHRKAAKFIIYSTRDCEKAAKAAGADAFVRKPSDLLSLVCAVRNCYEAATRQQRK